MRYILITGKNWRLALAEIDRYLQMDKYAGEIIDYSANAIVVEFDYPPEPDDIYDLQARFGSIQKIAQVYDFVDESVVKMAFPVDIKKNRSDSYANREEMEKVLRNVIFDLFLDIKDLEFFIANSIYPLTFDDPYYKVLLQYFLQFTNKFFNRELKKHGAKQAIYYKYPMDRIQKGTLNPIFPHHFKKYKLYKPNRVEIIYALTAEGMYIGKTITVTDANLHKELDEERPGKDFAHTIPPKFAKTLISFLQLTPPIEDYKILDPLCGDGTILQFGSMLGFDVFGADIQPEQVKHTRENLIWTDDILGFPIMKKKHNKQVIVSDIADIHTKFPENYFDGIATEPVLLPYFRELPEFQELKRLIREDVVPTYNVLLRQSFKLLKPGARLALVTPLIFYDRYRKVRFDMGELAEEAGFISLQLLNEDRIFESIDEKLKLEKKGHKSIFDTGSKHVFREFFLFQKPE